MFKNDKLTFIELHKTGGTHIINLINQVVGGTQIGKHNRITSAESDLFKIGSIRNPWDWYVSLWAYGCSDRGSVKSCVTEGVNISYYNRQLPKEMGKNWLSLPELSKQVFNDLIKPKQEWVDCYKNYESPKLFRAWLKMILSQKRKYDVKEGYGFSSLSQHSGLMTYRMFKLFTDLDLKLYDRSNKDLDQSALIETWHNHKITNKVIRNEFLEDDLISALKEAGYSLSDGSKEIIIDGRNKKINTSKRLAIGHYYDVETAELVARYESTIIELFQYSPPEI